MAKRIPLWEAQMCDTLHNAHPDVASSAEWRTYGRGVIVGLIGGIMGARNCTFQTAANAVIRVAVRNGATLHPDCVPPCWMEALAPIVAL